MTRSPLRPPIYAEPLLGDEASLTPDQALRRFCHGVKIALELDRKWQCGAHVADCYDCVIRDDGLHAALIVEPEGQRLALVITLQDDWIVARLAMNDRQARFFIERVYEEWEIWPERALGDGEAPGRISARLAWAQIEAAAWPGLVALAAGGLITAEPAES